MKKIIIIALAAIISMTSAAAQNSKKQIYIELYKKVLVIVPDNVQAYEGGSRHRNK